MTSFLAVLPAQARELGQALPGEIELARLDVKLTQILVRAERVGIEHEGSATPPRPRRTCSPGPVVLDRVCIPGVTLDELAEVAQTRPNRKVTLLRDRTAEQFHAHVRQANDPDRRYVINFSREHIFGPGAGHHSPIGGYLEGEDRVFVLDVNRDYEPWIVGRPRLLSAMDV